MGKENPVFQVLVTSGNQAPMAKDLTLDSLKIGQIAIMNAHSNLSIDGSVPGDAKDVYLVVGTGNAAAGQPLQDIAKSSGQLIQVRNTAALTFKGYTTAVPKIVEVSGFKAKCDTDYSLNIEFRNQMAYGVFGFNALKNVYNFHTGCCSSAIGCGDCSQEGDSAELAIGLMNAINKDVNKLATATLFANKVNFTVGAATTAGDVTFKIGDTTYKTTVAAGDTAAVVAGKIVATINGTTNGLYTASNVAGVLTVVPKTSTSGSTATASLTNAGGTGVTMTAISSSNTDVTNTDAFRAANPGAGLALRITTNTSANVYNGGVPVKYYNSSESDMIVSFTDSFSCNGKINTIQDMKFEDGNGANLALDEYVAGGWNGKPGPYRTNSVTGFAKSSITSNVSVSGTYNVINIDYDQFSVGGWLEYFNNLRTIIAVPCADSTTLNGLATMLSAVFNQFPTFTDDVAANGDCTNVPTAELTYATDGIELLA